MNELIGFLIVLAILLVPLLRKLFVDMKKVQEHEKRDKLLHKKVSFPIQKKTHVTERTVNQDFVFHSEIEVSSDFREKTVRVRTKKNLEELLRSKNSRQKMVLYSEILSAPKSMR